MQKAWVYLLMVALGVICIYGGWNWLETEPKEPSASIARTIHIGGFGLTAFGFLLAKYACETELKSRHKTYR